MLFRLRPTTLLTFVYLSPLHILFPLRPGVPGCFSPPHLPLQPGPGSALETSPAPTARALPADNRETEGLPGVLPAAALGLEFCSHVAAEDPAP